MSSFSIRFLWRTFVEMWRNSLRASRLIWFDARLLVTLFSVTLLGLSVAPFLISGSRGLLINELVASFGLGQFTPALAYLTGLLIMAGFLPAFLQAAQSYLGQAIFLKLEAKLEVMIVAKKSLIDIPTQEDPAFNDLTHRLTEGGVWRVRNFVDRQFYLLQNLLGVVIASVVLLSAGWWIFCVVLIGTIPLLIVEAKHGQRVWSIHMGKSETKRRYWELRRHFNRAVSLIELRLFQNSGHFISLIKQLFDSFRLEEYRAERKKLILMLVASLFSQLSLAAAVAWYVSQVVDGALLVGTFTFLISSLGDLSQSLSGLFLNIGRQYQDNFFVTDVFNFLDTKPVLPKPNQPVSLKPENTPSIVFDNVSFTYPDQTNPTLENISFVIQPGEKLAIVGHNGAGKTTLIKLLCRFYDPTAGRILVDGHDLKNLDLETWYHHLGILFQSYANYYFPIKEAIGLGRGAEALDEEKVKQAGQQSGADNFIQKYPTQYSQMLGKDFKDGVEPSGGEWQKLALARVFYRDPHIYVLDEPTAAIDAEAESKIFEQMEALPKDRTVVLVSHRFATVRRADKIILLNGGRLTEAGTHDELLKLNGTYARLFHLQAEGYTN